MEQKKSISAILTLVAGILAFIMHLVFAYQPIAWIVSFAAVALGVISLFKIKKNPELSGQFLCIIGLVLALILPVLIFLIFLFFSIGPARNMFLFT